MLIIGNLLISLSSAVMLAATVYSWIIVARALISWVSPDPFNPIVQFLCRTTDPVLEPIRRRLPMMGIDISPIIAWFLVRILSSFLAQTLFDIGYRLRG